MNANETDFPANPRLHRIKLVSRSAKYVCYGVFIYSIGFFLLYTSTVSFSTVITRGSVALAMVIIQVGLWIVFLKLKQRPHFNENFPLVPLMGLVQIFLWIGYWKLPSSQPSAGHFNWFWMLYQFSMWVWYWKLARLFGFYERGLIFAAETIRCIKTLGLVCVIGWMLGSISHFTSFQPPSVFRPVNVIAHQPILTNSPANEHLAAPLRTVTVSKHTVTHYNGFFSFDFGTGINFGPFVIGIIIVLIAWIMDEGRKIQEEQELTV